MRHGRYYRGGGERKTLRLVARYADACNLAATNLAEAEHKLDVLARHCDTEGRDFALIDKTVIAAADPLADVDGFLSAMEEYAGLGVQQVRVSAVPADPVGWVEQITTQVASLLSEF